MTARTISTTPIPSKSPASEPPAHHVGNPPTSFINPWPSFRMKHSLVSLFQIRFSKDRNFVPVPSTRDELVGVRVPDWGAGKNGLKATWFGHASFLVETAALPDCSRGVRILFDPVFADRMGPVGLVGPKRFSPLPCTFEEVPDVDVVAISHNHYDHLDVDAVRKLHAKRKGKLQFLCALGLKQWFLGCGVGEEEITELDWWQGVHVEVQDVGSVKMTCTPSQHASGRTPWDMGCALWCSWVLEEVSSSDGGNAEKLAIPKKLFFAGDTGYRTITTNDKSEDNSALPCCPAFAQIGEKYGPFDLALLPIGCFTPQTFMSGVHCDPDDALCIHKDIRSKRSIGMHYGTIRGGLSSQYEDVRDPPRRWKKACETAGLEWGEEIGLCDIGETVIV